MKWLALVVASGCAVTKTTCPVGSTLTVTHGADGRAQYCALEDGSRENLPGARTTAGVASPSEMRGVADGPFTAWHPNGVKAAQGGYRAIGERAVPDGLWAFWYPDAHLELLGRYVKGVPVGCFATWDERRALHTGVMNGGTMQEQSCTPPSDAQLAQLEGRVDDATPARGDAALSVFAGPNGIGANTAGQSIAHSMTLAFEGRARLYVGRLRVGAFASLRNGNDGDDRAFAAGGAAAWRLPVFTPRIDSEIGVELGVQHISVTPQQPARLADPLVFWAVLPAIEANAALALTPALSAVLGVRVDGIPTFGVEATSIYRGLTTSETLTETWRVGGINAGVTLGLRFSL